MIGKKVRVFWPVDESWYSGTVQKFDASTGEHLLQYQDGDTEWVKIGENNTSGHSPPVPIGGEGASAAAPPSYPPTSPGGGEPGGVGRGGPGGVGAGGGESGSDPSKYLGGEMGPPMGGPYGYPPQGYPPFPGMQHNMPSYRMFPPGGYPMYPHGPISPDDKGGSGSPGSEMGSGGKRKTGPKAWTKEEDALLLSIVKTMQMPMKWSIVAQSLPDRTGKQCRERYVNHLNPRLKVTDWNVLEDSMVFHLYNSIGSHWAKMVRSSTSAVCV